jgi:proteasome lid subunit RPN8/RPN11
MDGRNCKRRIDLQKITLSQSIKKTLIQHAENENPNESCAILYGNGDTVSDVFLTKNIEESPVNFTISNDQLIEGYKIAEEKKLQVIGIFHSHPNSEAYPSSTDKKFMHSNPVVWIIYSGANKNFKAYVLESDVLEIPIEN